ncbi:DUF2062 domain-containing protein [Terriglobus roseus]|uniref:DUF2062 domain-containing protein n=1 Tax=Terriglobus roseus TaxID=392734 RepID=A0A1H4Q9G2_9BACT|nr:DUF2062 domain-containing protein [Terriglobus roseus]SEC16235.1 hypothetical protein SAMN05443244_2805 [Terriglobus roseus]
MITKLEDQRHTWVRRNLVSPVVRMLRLGASPQRLAWSLAAGFVIGMNPIIGSTTAVTVAVTHLFKLKHAASQIGVHGAYPFQLLLLLPFLHAGTVLFGTSALPLEKADLLRLIHEHPLQLLRSLWMWEWHALVVWLGFAVVLMPALAMLLGHMLERAMRHPRMAVR